MNFLEILIGAVALGIGIYTLVLQLKEIKKNSKINALVHLSSLLEQKIEFHRRILEDQKSKNENWKGHADKINNDLRPLKSKVDSALIDISGQYSEMPNAEVIKTILVGKSDDS